MAQIPEIRRRELVRDIVKTKFNIPKEWIEERMKEHRTYQEMADEIGCSAYTVMKKANSYGLHSDARKYQQTVNNVMFDPDTKEKVSDSTRTMWAEGYYKERVNGILGVKGYNDPKYTGKWDYREKALFYHGKVCSICGEPIKDEEKCDIHHIDEDHNNNALTNLEVCHVTCHQLFHYKCFKMPYVSVTKMFEFESAHFLPDHYADCRFLHGHSYKLEVTVKHRINPRTGMALDFKKLKEAVDKNVIQQFDHAFVNDWLDFPTAENMLYWIWERLSKDVKGLVKLRLFETSTSYAEITIDDVLELIRSCDFETDWLDDDRLLKRYEFTDVGRD